MGFRSNGAHAPARGIVYICVVALGLALAGCFGGETVVISQEDDAGAGGGGGIGAGGSGGMGAGGSGGVDGSGGEGGSGGDVGGGGDGGSGGAPVVDDACDFELDLMSADALDGFDAPTERWSAGADGVTAGATGQNGLLLRPADTACTDFVARADFVYAAGAYPLLVGRANDAGTWFAVGHDGRFDIFTARSGAGLDPFDRSEPLVRVALVEGETYTLELRVVDDLVTGALYDRHSDRPLAAETVFVGEVPGPGRIGLLERAGDVAVRFTALSAASIVRDGAAALTEARVVDPETVIVTASPRPDTAIEVAEDAGFALDLGAQQTAVAGAALPEGSRSEVRLAAGTPIDGGDAVQVDYDGTGVSAGGVAFPAVAGLEALNLVHDDAGFAAIDDDFDGATLQEGWLATDPAAFSVAQGAVRINPVSADGQGAFLRRGLGDRSLAGRIALDFEYTRAPVRQGADTVITAALRVRSANSRYQGVLRVGDFSAALALQVVDTFGAQGVGAPVDVPLADVPEDTPLRLVLSARGRLLWADLFRIDGAEPVRVASVAAPDNGPAAILQPGPAGFTLTGSGTATVDRVRIDLPEGAPIRIGTVQVPADAPTTIEVEILASSALQNVGADGFTVWAPERRTITDVSTTAEGLRLTLDGPPIHADQRVSLTYDPAAGGITDSSRPAALPLAGVDRLPVDNAAPANERFALAWARLVTPDTVDLVLTDSGMLPAVAGDAAGLTVEVDGADVSVITVRTLEGRDDIVRVSIDADATPGSDVRVGWTGGLAGPIEDAGGAELEAFGEAVAENLLRAPDDYPPFVDDFGRPDAETAGGEWAATTPGLWDISGEQLRYRGPGEALDARLLLPDARAYANYRASVRFSTPDAYAFPQAVQAAIVGSFNANNPNDQFDDVELRAAYDFINNTVFVARSGLTLAGFEPDPPIAPGEEVTLRLVVNGQAVGVELRRGDGTELAAQGFSEVAVQPGRIGLAGAADGLVFYDDFRVEAPAEPEPDIVVVGASVSAREPNDVRVDLGSRTGRVRSSGTAAGWSVRVDGRAREVERVVTIGSAAKIRIAGDAIAARETVEVAYDDRAGDLHDDGEALPRPLAGFDFIEATNEAAIGDDLFIVGAETVGPWGVDLILNANAPLPPQAEGGLSGSINLTTAGSPVDIRAVLPVPGRAERVRLLLGEALPAGTRLRVTYTPGEDGGRLLDADGTELSAPYQNLPVDNLIEPDADFPAFADDFGGVGNNIVNGWIPNPEVDWRRDNGAAVYARSVESPGPSLMRPADEAQRDVELTAVFSVQSPPEAQMLAGALLRSSANSGYQGRWSSDITGAPVMAIDRFAGGFFENLATVPASRAVDGVDYALRMRAHGPVITFEVTRDGAPIGRVAAVDEDLAAGAGQSGLLAGGFGSVRFESVEIQPATGYPARVAATGARVLNFEPSLIRIGVASAAPLGYTDGGGFTVRVNGMARGVESVELADSEIRLQLAADVQPDDDVEIDFDPTTGVVLDASEVPQPLGPIDALVAEVLDPPVLAATEVVGENLVLLTFDVPAGEAPLEVAGDDGGLQVWADIEGEEVRFDLQVAWVDPISDGDAVLLATPDPLPTGVDIFVRYSPRGGAQVTDQAGASLAPFDAAPLLPLSRVRNDFDAPAMYETSWRMADGDSGWRYYPADRWTESDGELVTEGAGENGATVEAYAPPAISGADFKVQVDFTIDDVIGPVGDIPNPAFPRVNVRGADQNWWVGCYIRNGFNAIPENPAPGMFQQVDDFSPSFLCVKQEGAQPIPAEPGVCDATGGRCYYNPCRMQFYESGGTVRYAWADTWMDPHRIVVKVSGGRLRGELWNLSEARYPGDTPKLVAVSEVADIGDTLRHGLPGLGSFEGGRVRFSDFRVDPLGAEAMEFPPIPADLEPTGECN